MGWVRAFPIVLAFAWVAGCRGESQGPTTGSETHFLSWCSRDGSCEDGLACVCGVCTEGCGEASECAAYGVRAECRDLADKPADQACSDAPVAAACEAACGDDADCTTFGEDLRCDRGFCRRLASDCVQGDVDASGVVVLGDSFFGASHEITAELERLARARGALDAGDSYRDYSSSLISPFGGGADLTSQYTTASEEGAVRIAIMNIGGPEVLLSACPEPPDATCPGLQSAVAGAEALLQRMADDGVEAVLDVSHPDPADETFRAQLSVLRPLLRDVCEASPVRCYSLDLAPTFEGRTDEYLLSDGLNPTTQGANVAAAVIWSAMQRRCLAQ